MDWSPDGARIVSVPSGQVSVTFTDGQKPERATFTGRVAYVWDPATGRDLIHLRGHDDNVASARFNPAGTRIVTASWDGTARIWNAVSGKELHVLKGHTNSLLTALFSPDGKRVLTVCTQEERSAFDRDRVTGKAPPDQNPNTDPGPTTRPFRFEGSSGGMSGRSVQAPDPAFARLWDADTGQQVGELALDPRAGWKYGRPPRPRLAAYSPDSGRVAIGFDDLVEVWPAAGGAPEHVFVEDLRQVRALAFAPDGGRLAAAGDRGVVAVWDLRTGTREHRLEDHQRDHPVTALEFSDFGRRLVSAGTDQTARVWEVRTGKELAVLRGHARPVVGAHFLDADTVLTAGDRTVRVWSVPAPRPVSTPLAEPDPPGGRLGKWFGTAPARHTDLVTALAFAPDGRSVFTGSYDRTVRQWDPATGRQLARFPTPLQDNIRGIAVGPAGVVYVGTDTILPNWRTDPAVYRWEPAAGRVDPILRGVLVSVEDLELSPDGRRLLVLGAEHYWNAHKTVPMFAAWDTATGKRLWDAPPTADVHERLRPRFSPDGRTVVYWTDRPDELALYDAATGARVRALAMPKWSNGIQTPQGFRGPRWGEVRFSPDGRVVVGQASGESDLWFWDPATGELLGSFRFPRDTTAWGARTAFTPDSRRLAVTAGPAVQVIDVPTRTGVHLLRGHEDNVTALAFSPDGSKLLTGSDDQTAALWDVESGRLVTVYRGRAGAINLVAYSPDGTRVATVGAQELLARVWPVDVVPAFEKLKPRELTPAERVRYELTAGGRRE
jgi:WD40 repeat protein